MDLRGVEAFCLALPGAELSIKWGDDHCYVVGGKMFAAHAAGGDTISFKCSPDAFEMLTESGVASPARYLARAKWVTVGLGDMPGEELTQRLRDAYAIIRSGLTKKAQAALGPMPQR